MVVFPSLVALLSAVVPGRDVVPPPMIIPSISPSLAWCCSPQHAMVVTDVTTAHDPPPSMLDTLCAMHTTPSCSPHPLLLCFPLLHLRSPGAPPPTWSTSSTHLFLPPSTHLLLPSTHFFLHASPSQALPPEQDLILPHPHAMHVPRHGLIPHRVRESSLSSCCA